jgi:chemotaxis protein MotB
MPKYTWFIAAMLSALVVIAFVGYTAWEQFNQLNHIRSDLRRAQSSLETNLAYAATLEDKILAGQEQIERLQKEKEAVKTAQQSLEKEMRAALESKDVTISALQGRLTVNILDKILFDSGEAIIKPEGEAVLQKIADVLAQHTNRQVHVIGHTDNVPIHPKARSRFPSNWELSTARATAAVRFLCEKAGVDPNRLGAVGYGEFHPVANNAAADGRAQNRRIELVVLPEELSLLEPAKPVSTEQPPASTPSTNAPAAEASDAKPPHSSETLEEMRL